MGVLSAIIGVVFLIYLLLRIAGMVGGPSRSVQVINEPHDDRPALPDRSPEEVEALVASMPTAWVVYEGMTPSLNIQVRGLTEELYRRFTRAQADAFGQEVLARLPMTEKLNLMTGWIPIINAQGYVVRWSGAQYPNGKPLPATSENLAMLMRKDEMLKNFISEEANKLGMWP
jgi:hypothetical protein